MDAYFPVIDPVGFFVFVFGPGLLFWTMASIFKWGFYEDLKYLEILHNKLLDKLILVSGIGIVLTIISKIIINISIFANPFLPTMEWLGILLCAVGFSFLAIVYLRIRYKSKWLKKIEIICHILLIIGIISIQMSSKYESHYIWSGTIFESMSIGMLSFWIIMFLFMVFFGQCRLEDSFVSKADIKIQPYISTSFILIFVVMLGVFSEFIPMSTIYNIQTASPIHYSVLTNNCFNSTMNTTLILVNTLDRDIGITSIELKNSIAYTDTSLPLLLKKKEAFNYDMSLNENMPIKLREGYFIRLKTTEGIIPVEIPMDICKDEN